MTNYERYIELCIKSGKTPLSKEEVKTLRRELPKPSILRNYKLGFCSESDARDEAFREQDWEALAYFMGIDNDVEETYRFFDIRGAYPYEYDFSDIDVEVEDTPSEDMVDFDIPCPLPLIGHVSEQFWSLYLVVEDIATSNENDRFRRYGTCGYEIFVDMFARFFIGSRCVQLYSARTAEYMGCISVNNGLHKIIYNFISMGYIPVPIK